MQNKFFFFFCIPDPNALRVRLVGIMEKWEDREWRDDGEVGGYKWF